MRSEEKLGSRLPAVRRVGIEYTAPMGRDVIADLRDRISELEYEVQCLHKEADLYRAQLHGLEEKEDLRG